MTIFITQILRDIRSTNHIYNHLEQTEIETLTDYEKAKDHLKDIYTDIKYNHFKYAEKVKENEDYLDCDFCEEMGSTGIDVCDFMFRITDGTDWFSGQILKKEI
jgi:regulator of replication initiation timing